MTLAKSNISWTQHHWPITEGCTPVSPGCAHCWAATFVHTRLAAKAERFRGLTKLAGKLPVYNGTVRFQPEALTLPLAHRKPGTVFVSSRSDLFHEAVTDEQIAAVFGVMAATPHLTYQVLTKRAERARRWFAEIDARSGAFASGGDLCLYSAAAWLNAKFDRALDRAEQAGRCPWPLPNVHIGVTVEDQQRADDRIPHLLAIPAAVRWLSIEPMLGPIDLDDLVVDDGRPGEWHVDALNADGLGEEDDPEFKGNTIDWVVVGGESGPGARPCDVEWVRSIVRQCRAAVVRVYVKQLGTRPRIVVGSDDDGEHWPVEGFGTDRKAGLAPGGGQWLTAPLRHPHGANPAEWPEDLRVREVP